jgi:surface protein
MHSQTIAVRDRAHLKELIAQEIAVHGNNCSLNHMDVSGVKDMSRMFKWSRFSGDISQWNTAQVTIMAGMFFESEFNGDISQWNTSQVKDMSEMFYGSQFNGDISQWNTSQVKNMSEMFYGSQFNGDISQWNTSKVTDMYGMFYESQFTGDLRKWQLNEKQTLSCHLKEIFHDTFPQYLAVRRSIEEKELLCATFSPPTKNPSNKKTL